MEQEIKQNFSHNLITLRKANNLTQAELAEKLNYSDKSVSKWERGDVLPDIVTLSMIAQYFSVTVDGLIGSEEPAKRQTKKIKHMLITTMSICLVMFIASLAFLICNSLSVKHSWMIYIYALPCASIVGIVLACIWYNNIVRASFVSVLVWTIGLAVYLSITIFTTTNIWFVFIVCLVFQILVLLWFFYRDKIIRSIKR